MRGQTSSVPSHVWLSHMNLVFGCTACDLFIVLMPQAILLFASAMPLLAVDTLSDDDPNGAPHITGKRPAAKAKGAPKKRPSAAVPAQPEPEASDETGLPPPLEPGKPSPKKGAPKKKAKASPKKKAKASPKKKANASPKKALRSSPEPTPPTPKAKADTAKPLKRPAASQALPVEGPAPCKINKYQYKNNGVWGFKVNGREMFRASWKQPGCTSFTQHVSASSRCSCQVEATGRGVR